MNKICSKCGVSKDIREFYRQAQVTSGYRASCKECDNKYREEYAENNSKSISKKAKKYYRRILDHRKDYYYKRNYGITKQQKDSMITDQDNRCLSCGIDLRQLSPQNIQVDHNHKTNEIRGILCHNCNTALGLLNEDIERTFKLSLYVVNHCVTDKELRRKLVYYMQDHLHHLSKKLESE